MLRTILRGLLGLSVVFLLGLPIRGSTLSIGVMPITQSIAVGSPITIFLQIQGLGDSAAPSVGAFDLNLAYDPGILSFDNAVFGDPALGDQLDPTNLGNTISFDSPGFGTVELFDLSLDADTDLNNLQASAFVSASVTFDVIGAGTSALDLSVNSLGDADGNSLAAVLENGAVDAFPATTAPEPASAVLCGAAIVLGAFLKQRGFRVRNLR